MTFLSELSNDTRMQINGDGVNKSVYTYRYNWENAYSPGHLLPLENPYGQMDQKDRGLLADAIEDNRRARTRDKWDLVFISREPHCMQCGIDRAFLKDELSYYCPVCERDDRVWSVQPEIQP